VYDHGYHLGISDKGFATCFKCGWHSIESTLHALLDCGYKAAKHYAKTICGTVSDIEPQKDVSFKIPSSGKLFESTVAFEYMAKRMPHHTEKEITDLAETYDIRYTDYGYYDMMLAGRIVFPNYYRNKAVSWQCRDFLNVHKCKYITAPKDGELLFHKNFLWGIDKVPYDKVIVCEGVMDALTIGAGAVHTHGVKFSHSQACELMGFSDVYICYDSDDAGRDGARSLASLLSHKTRVHIVKISGKDINSCSKQEIEDVKGLLQ
jgi:5S rRNA maturation endonuclease (ribonuclease M5)